MTTSRLKSWKPLQHKLDIEVRLHDAQKKLAALGAPIPLCPLAAQSKLNVSATPQIAAPVPDPILKGKRAFISYRYQYGGLDPSVFSGGPGRAYNEFYGAMKQWGHYELVSDPHDADVVFAISGLGPALTVSVTDKGGAVSLWGFEESIPMSTSKKNRDANFSRAVAQLVKDIQQLFANGASSFGTPA
jgi:hypothetical protein